jgi:Protein of unknown function (DUF3489)
MAKKTTTTKTRAGAKAAGKSKRKNAAPAQAARTGTKRAQLVTMLKQGATVDALTKSLGWLPHTLRAAICGLNKAGTKVERERVEGITSYKISA